MINLSLKSRLSVLDMVTKSGEGHIASSYSIAEILIAIYQSLANAGRESEFMSHLVLSKGHAAYGLYGLLHSLGELTDEEVATVGQPGSYLIGHVPVKPERGFFIGTGSLGQGLPMALGRAFGRRQSGDSIPEFVIVGDGEFNEGSCWESLLLMKKFPKLKMRVIIDANHSSDRAIPMADVFDAIRAGWKTVDVHGHDVDAMVEILRDDSDDNLIIIAATEKGWPLARMRANPVWHHKMPNAAEANEIKQELAEFFGGTR